MEWFQELHLGAVIWVMAAFSVVGIYLDNRKEPSVSSSRFMRKREALDENMQQKKAV